MSEKRAALVVDGDRTFRHFAMRAVQQLDCNVIGLHDAEEALRWFALHAPLTPPAIVTIDPALRRMDGFDLCRRIRAMSNVPIVFASSRIAVDDYVLAIDAGANEFLTKPIQPSLYVDTVDRWLSGGPQEITVEVSLDFHIELSLS
jgi:DNA-binding response OmpR family regulator